MISNVGVWLWAPSGLCGRKAPGMKAQPPSHRMLLGHFYCFVPFLAGDSANAFHASAQTLSGQESQKVSTTVEVLLSHVR